jgi:hypothetical protein
MANIFKQIKPDDRVSTRTLLHEAIPLTGTIVSGTYGTFPNEENIKNYGHGMFQSVYDYPYLSSSANHIFDISVGYSNQSPLSSTVLSTHIQQSKKVNMYTEMAQVAVGYNITGGILQFDEDGDILAGGNKIQSGYFINLTRLLMKDEIKKGSFALTLGMDDLWAVSNHTKAIIKDFGGVNDYRVNSPLGEYGLLYATASVNDNALIDETTSQFNSTYKASVCGLIYYQAGIVVLSGSLFNDVAVGGLLQNSAGSCVMSKPAGTAAKRTISEALTGSSISSSADNLRHRFDNLQFNNTVELNSTIYFCRMNHNEFNYSGNPTYLSSSQIRVKQVSTDQPISYVTTVGLYSENNELLAVGKLSEPLKKTPANEFTIRTRLDY